MCTRHVLDGRDVAAPSAHDARDHGGWDRQLLRSGDRATVRTGRQLLSLKAITSLHIILHHITAIKRICAAKIKVKQKSIFYVYNNTHYPFTLKLDDNYLCICTTSTVHHYGMLFVISLPADNFFPAVLSLLTPFGAGEVHLVVWWGDRQWIGLHRWERGTVRLNIMDPSETERVLWLYCTSMALWPTPCSHSWACQNIFNRVYNSKGQFSEQCHLQSQLVLGVLIGGLWECLLMTKMTW